MSWAPAESEPGGGRSDAAPIGLLAGASGASVWADQPLGAARPATLSVPALPNPRVPATWLLRGARHPRCRYRSRPALDAPRHADRRPGDGVRGLAPDERIHVSSGPRGPRAWPPCQRDDVAGDPADRSRQLVASRFCIPICWSISRSQSSRPLCVRCASKQVPIE